MYLEICIKMLRESNCDVLKTEAEVSAFNGSRNSGFNFKRIKDRNSKIEMRMENFSYIFPYSFTRQLLLFFFFDLRSGQRQSKLVMLRV